MSTPRQSITVSRNYNPAPDACAHALELLLKPYFNSQASKGGPHDLTGNSIKECMTRQDQKGMQNADLHGN
jgi:hypothetical protein